MHKILMYILTHKVCFYSFLLKGTQTDTVYVGGDYTISKEGGVERKTERYV